MKTLVFAICTILVCLTAQAQETKRYIEVTGSAEAEVTPNIIVLSIRLKEFMEGKTKVTLDQIDGEFRAAVTKSNIDKGKMVLSDLNLFAYQRRRTDRDVLAQKTYEITFSKSEEVIAFLENLKSVQVDFLRVARLDHTDMEKHRLQLKVDALKAAESKAGALLAAVSAKRGRPIVIEEISADATPWAANFEAQAFYYSNQSARYSSNADTGTPDVPLRTIRLRYEIRAKFEIE